MYTDWWGFDSRAETYDTDVYDASRQDHFIFQAYDRVLDTIISYCQGYDVSSVRLLDIGIGTGNLTGRFLRQGFHVYGLEPSPKMREICRRKFPDIPVTDGHFLDIPFPPASIDVIVSSYAFHHLKEEEKVQAAREMKRVLKPDGCIIIADLMFRNADERRRLEQSCIDAGHPEIPEEYADEYPGYYDDLEKVFTASGFTFDGEQLTQAIWIIRARL
jgi:putative AdoMet-dependent methyltransferase